MKIVTALLTAIALMLVTGSSQAQTLVRDLSGVVENGTIVLESARGTGASSGSSVEGVLTNETDHEINIDIFMSNPIYLVNRGAGQNMMATQVYGRDGGYKIDGKTSFITLKPREKSRVTFVAYCADFEKENPTSGDGFSVGQVPNELSQVMKNIVSFARANPDRDITEAAQVAVWLAQGQTPDEIAEKFKFSAEDERQAYELLR